MLSYTFRFNSTAYGRASDIRTVPKHFISGLMSNNMSLMGHSVVLPVVSDTSNAMVRSCGRSLQGSVLVIGTVDGMLLCSVDHVWQRVTLLGKRELAAFCFYCYCTDGIVCDWLAMFCDCGTF